jgi:CDP-diacylglycerol---serine O-phosphatidyltransferase
MQFYRRRLGDPPVRLRKGMYILPSLFTTANLAAGFFAIVHAALGAARAQGFDVMPGANPMDLAAHDFNQSAIAIGFAVFFDGMDGAIARVTHTTSDFGKELDSLADVVTFGVAPAVLAWLWGFFCLPNALVGPEVQSRFLRFGIYLDGDLRNKLIQFGAIVAFAYLTAGACRLARFNIQLNPQPKNPGLPGRKYFVGMPIPGGAGCLAAVVHLRMGHPVSEWWSSIVWMAYICLCAFLMVSTWRFWSSKSIDFSSRKAARIFVLLGIMLTAIWFLHRIVLFVMALTYLISGVFSRVAYSFRRRGPAPPTPPPSPEHTGNGRAGDPGQEAPAS